MKNKGKYRPSRLLTVCAKLSLLFFCLNLTAQTDSLIFAKTIWTTTPLTQNIQHFHHHFTQDSIFKSKQNIHYIKMNISDAQQVLSIARADTGKLNTSDFAKNVEALAAINGSFFNVQTGASVNFIKINGNITDTTFYDEKQKTLKANQQGVLAFDNEGMSIIPRTFDKKDWWKENLTYKNAIESGPLLIMNYIPFSPAYTPFSKNRHPRTAVCLTEDALIMLTADGRSAQAYGLSIGELTEVMSWLNCKNALNLDGGGSTTMYIKDEGVVNMPSDNKLWDHAGERAVNNALLLLSRNHTHN